MSVKLAPSDAPENVITVSTEVANMSVTIKNMLEGAKKPFENRGFAQATSGLTALDAATAAFLAFLSLHFFHFPIQILIFFRSDFGGATDTAIPLHNVSSKILQKVVDYCQHHVANPAPAKTDDKKDDKKDEISPWDKEFCTVDQATLFELILAANYLDIKPLLDLTCKTVANMIKGKTPEEIRKTFNIKNDFTPEEEEKVRKENEWCEER